MTTPEDIDPEGFTRGGDGCICGPLYTYAGHVEPGQISPECPYHNSPEDIARYYAWLEEHQAAWEAPPIVLGPYSDDWDF